jgi:hypothetical protein
VPLDRTWLGRQRLRFMLKFQAALSYTFYLKEIRQIYLYTSLSIKSLPWSLQDVSKELWDLGDLCIKQIIC